MAHPALAATLPSDAEAGVAKETSRLLASRMKKGTPMQLRILDDEAGQATVNSRHRPSGCCCAFSKRWRTAMR